MQGKIVLNPTSKPCPPEQPDPSQFVSTRYWDTCEYKDKSWGTCWKKSRASGPAGQVCKTYNGELEKYRNVQGTFVESSPSNPCIPEDQPLPVLTFTTCEFKGKEWGTCLKEATAAPAGSVCKNKKGEHEKYKGAEGKIVDASTAKACK